MLPSALLGPAVWRPVVRTLSGLGWELVEVPGATSAPRTPDDVLATYLHAIPADRPVVVVPHSNAGLFVPAITEQRQVDAVVFVDAGLPPRAGTFPVAPSEFRAFLEGLADHEGALPAWTEWWGDEVSGLFPSAGVRDEVEAEQQRLPLAYFSRLLSAPPGWDERPAAYLAFGDTYAANRADARDRGWAVSALAGEHLHMLVDPDGVAHEIEDLLGRVGVRPGSDP